MRQIYNTADMTNLRSEFFYFRRQFLALLGILPLGRFLALDDLQQVQVLLLELLLLQQQFVEAKINTQENGSRVRIGSRLKVLFKRAESGDTRENKTLDRTWPGKMCTKCTFREFCVETKLRVLYSLVTSEKRNFAEFQNIF